MKRPNTRSLLPGFVENYIDKWFSCLRINLSENLGRNLNEVAIEFALVPFRESLGQLCSVHFHDVFEDGVRFADQLDVAVLDTVVHHLDVMTGAVRSHVTAARFAIHLRRDLAKERRDNFP